MSNINYNNSSIPNTTLLHTTAIGEPQQEALDKRVAEIAKYVFLCTIPSQDSSPRFPCTSSLMSPFWRNTNKEISQIQLGTAVERAAQNGDLEAIKFFLSENKTLLPQDFQKAVLAAAQAKKIDVMQWLLNEYKTLSHKDLQEIGNKNDDIEITKFLLNKGVCFSPSQLYSHCRSAIARGDDTTDSIEFVLNKLQELISPNKLNVNDLISPAIRANNSKLLEFMVKNGEPLDAHCLSQAMVTAVIANNIDCARLLFHVNNALSQRDFENIMRMAACDGHIDFAKFLLHECGTLTLSQEGFDNAMQAAAAHDHIDFAKFLLEELAPLTLNSEGFDDAMQAAAAHDHIDFAKFLLEELTPLTLNSEGFDNAMQAAAAHDHIDFAKFLFEELAPLTLSSEGFDNAMQAAAAHDHIDFAHLLVENDGLFMLTQKGFDAAMQTAAREGHVDFAEFLLEECGIFTLSQEGFKNVIKESYSDYSVLAYILDQGDALDIESLKSVVIYAVNNALFNDTEFLNSFLGTYPLDHHTLSLAVIHAATQEGGSAEVVDVLLKHGPISEEARNYALTHVDLDSTEASEIQELLSHARITSSTDSYEPSEIQEYLNQTHITFSADPLYNDSNPFKINLKEVTESPLKYLKEIHEKGFPSSVTVINDDGSTSKASDAGGLTKQFIASLCNALITQRYLYVTDAGIPMTTTPQQTQCYEYLGHLISFIHAWNSSDKTDAIAMGYTADEILTGYLFNENFLQMIKAIAVAPNEEAGFQQVCALLKTTNPALSTTIDLIVAPTEERKQAYLEESLGDPESPLDEVVQEARASIHNNYYLAAKSFLAGTTEPFKSALMTVDPAALLRSFQGDPISVKGVMQALRLDDNTPFPKNIQSIIAACETSDPVALHTLQEDLRHKLHAKREVLCTTFLDKVQVLVEFIASRDISQAEDLEWLKAYVFTCTGKNALAPNTSLVLTERKDDKEHFESHTCWNSLAIPRGKCTIEELIQFITNSIDANADYNYT